jgi:two-component system sensor kinase FixL
MSALGDEAGAGGTIVVTAREVVNDDTLRADGARWRAVIDSAVDGMVVIDARGIIEVFNPAAERLFGYTAREAIGQNVNMLMPSPYHEEHDGYIGAYLRTGEQKVIGVGREVTGRRRDGSTFPVHLAVGEMTVAGERHFTGILHDLTPRVQLEARVREQTSLARLGEMAAVIAHEVKNPLAAVRGAVQVDAKRLPAESPDQPIMQEVVARIDALDELIKDLLLFARAPQPRLALVDLRSLIALTAEFLLADPSLHDVHFDIAGDASPVNADAELLRIVLQNLLLNAAQAMQRQGTIAIRVDGDGSTERITVADTGPGLSAEAQANLFRPFFTTKARGTGLGLPTARRLIELHGGTIAVASSAGRGTTVTIMLPAMPRRPA